MVSVASLLNHEPDHEQLPTPAASIRDFSECSPTPSERQSKRPRLAKDAAVFQRSKVKGQVRFAPWDTPDTRVLEEMERLNVYPLPLAKIEDFPRHIPYNSDKKRLFEKTGRDAFEGICQGPFLKAFAKFCSSISIHIPASRPRTSLCCSVGLQHRSCQNDSVLQML